MSDLGFIIIICALPIVVTIISIEMNLKKTNKQNQEIIELLKQLKEK